MSLASPRSWPSAGQTARLNLASIYKEALAHASVLFIAVGTPMGADGQADLRYVLEVAKSIGQNLTSPLIVVDKSTVSVGTAKRLAK